MNSFALLAALTVFVHVMFIAFAMAGGLLAVRWPRLAWAHLPAAGWAVFVEMSGGICPLTPLEQAWRQRAGLPGYSGDFVANYVFPVLYPEGLTRGGQMAISALLVIVNVLAYAWVYHQRRTRAYTKSQNPAVNRLISRHDGKNIHTASGKRRKDAGKIP